MIENGKNQLKPHRGDTILVLGILGLVVCGICGIIALVMATSDLKEMDAGTMDPEGRSNTNIGRILGIIATVLIGVGLIAMFLIFIPAIFAGTSGRF